MVFQQIMNGVIIGASYSLIALGLNLIWSITDIPDFSQGGIYVIAAYAGYFAVKLADIPFPIAVLLAMVTGAVIAYSIERFLYRRWIGQGRIQLLCAIALFFLLSNLAIRFWTAKSKFFPTYLPGGITIGNFMLSYQRIVVLVVATGLFITVYMFIQRTKMGKAIRAVSQDSEAAVVVGIDMSKVYSLVFIIGGALSGTAAVLISPLYSVQPMMGELPLLKSLVVVVLGGFGSVTGVLVGGIGLGLLESLGAVYISSGYQHGFAFFILILVLLFFPKGLFGRV